MAEFDLAVRGGEVATGFGTVRCDIGVKDGRIVALAERIADATRVVEADGLLVLPGGVDSHCHIEEPSRGGYASTGLAEPPVTVNEESFATASAAAFAGAPPRSSASSRNGRVLASGTATSTTGRGRPGGCSTIPSTRSSPIRRMR